MQVNNILLYLLSENANKLSKFNLVKDMKTFSVVLHDEEVAIFKEWITVKKQLGTTPIRNGCHANHALINLGCWCEVRFPPDFDTISIFPNPSCMQMQAGSKVRNMTFVSPTHSDFIRVYTDNVQKLVQFSDHWLSPTRDDYLAHDQESCMADDNSAIAGDDYSAKDHESCTTEDMTADDHLAMAVVKLNNTVGFKQRTLWTKLEEEVLLKEVKAAQLHRVTSSISWEPISKSVNIIGSVNRTAQAVSFFFFCLLPQRIFLLLTFFPPCI
jgi:hypothetical protein